MRSTGIRKAIEVQATALGPVLYAGVSTALAGSRKRNAGLGHETYPHLIPTTLRCELREYLRTHHMPPGWAIAGDPRKMGQLMLSHSELGLNVRFLKERRHTYPAGIPVAGSNAARRQSWISDPLDFPIPAPTRPKGEPLHLLLLWDFLSKEQLDQFTLRIVHTLAPGVYGHAVPCDLIFDVQAGGSVYSRLAFEGFPDEGDLFTVDVAEEDNESGT